MNYQTIDYQTKGAIGFLYLNRPQTSNVIDEQMEYELCDVLEKIGDDDQIKVVVIASHSDKIFSTGAAQTVLTQNGGDDDEGETVAELRRRLSSISAWECLAALPKPKIAAVSGVALGAGLELALACDIRIAGDNATFGFPEIRMGLIPSHGGTQRLPRIVGRAKAIEMILSGEPIDAKEAHRVELVSTVVPTDQVLTAAEDMASKLTGFAPIALHFAQDAIGQGSDMTFDQGLHLEMDLYALLQTTEDRDEGIRSFREKRPPKFEGR